MEGLSNEQSAWLKAAESGDLMGAFNIGKYFFEAEKFDLAKKYLSQVASKGHLGGLFKYGELLIKLGENEEAKNWLKMAADKGHVRAKELYNSI